MAQAQAGVKKPEIASNPPKVAVPGNPVPAAAAPPKAAVSPVAPPPKPADAKPAAAEKPKDPGAPKAAEAPKPAVAGQPDPGKPADDEKKAGAAAVADPAKVGGGQKTLDEKPEGKDGKLQPEANKDVALEEGESVKTASGSSQQQDLSHVLYPVQTRNVKGSSIKEKTYRMLKFPFNWMYNKMMGHNSIDKIKIMARYLPVFYVIPKQSEADVMPNVKKHVIQLKDGRKIIALKDMLHCRDSRSWYHQEKSGVVACSLIILKYDQEIIEELDAESSKMFGRFLKSKWDSGKLQAEEEIAYQEKVRPS